MEPSDIETMYIWENDPEVWRVGGTTSPVSLERLARFVAEQDYDIYASRQTRLVIEAEGIAVGSVDILDFDPQHLRFGIGILIYAPEHRRQGYAHAAIETIKRYARETLMLRQIWASVAADNSASIALFEVCAFEVCGRRKAWLRRPEGYVDQLELQCLL